MKAEFEVKKRKSKQEKLSQPHRKGNLQTTVSRLQHPSLLLDSLEKLIYISERTNLHLPQCPL
jgi:hypothetical protein